jgi:hypothetical protein
MLKKSLSQILQSKGTLLQNIMGGFSVQGEASLWRKLDKIYFKLVDKYFEQKLEASWDPE